MKLWSLTLPRTAFFNQIVAFLYLSPFQEMMWYSTFCCQCACHLAATDYKLWASGESCQTIQSTLRHCGSHTWTPYVVSHPGILLWKWNTALGYCSAAAEPVLALGWAALWALLPPQQSYFGICWGLLQVHIAGCSCWQEISPSALSQCKPVRETWTTPRSICSDPSLPICHRALCFP